jgi:5-methylcytosine-specific restriction endonuclease McrA
MDKLCTKCGRVEEFYQRCNICKKCCSDQSKKWAKENPERKKLLYKRWQKKHPEYGRERQMRYRSANREKTRAAVNRWQVANPEKRSKNENFRRARKAGNGGRYTAQEWKDLCDYYGNKCLRCGRTDVKLTVDHVNPIKLGGVNSIENIQPLCKHCNSSKGTKIIDYRW